MTLEENNNIHYNDGRRRLSEKFNNLIQELSGKDIQEKLTLILSPEHTDTINKRIITLRTLTIEQLSDMLSLDAHIVESHFGEKFNNNDRLRNRDSNLEEFHRNQTLELLKKQDQSGEPIQYKGGSFK